MAAITSTVIAAIGLGLSAAGGVVQYMGQRKVAAAQKKQEKLRKQQMNLDLMRQRREALRKMLLARALGISNATTQGAVASDSAVQGGISQAVGSANISLKDINQNGEIGTSMFAANAQEAAGGGMASMGGAISSWGSGMVQNSTTISRVGASFGLWKNPY